MRQQIDEIEDERTDALWSDRGAKMSLELVGVGARRDLLIANRRLSAELIEVRFEQLPLVGIE